MPTQDTHADTVLARRLHESGAVDLPTLQRCLQEVRDRRQAEPGLSLSLLLLRDRVVEPQVLEQAIPRPDSDAGLSTRSSTPTSFGEYEVVRELARGGMGAVYEAVHLPTGTRRAIKTLLPAGLDALFGQEERQRLREEAVALGRLDHPAIVGVHGGDFEAEPPYLVQDLLSGGSLEARLRDGPLEIAHALEIARALGDGLTHAHAQGILHRDLKPDNVLFDERGAPYLVDFGLARRIDASLRLTLSGTILGTPGYMPPEQATGDTADARSDVYGLAAVLYAMLTGRAPFTGSSPIAILTQVLEKRPAPPSELRSDLPAELDAVVLRALAKSPGDRFADIDALTAALDLEATRPRRRRGILAIVGTLSVALIAGILASASTRTPAEDPAQSRAPAPAKQPTETTYKVGWTQPQGSRFQTTITTNSSSRMRGVRTPNLLTVTSDTTVEANDGRRVSLRGRVSRIQGRVFVPADPKTIGVPASSIIAFDSLRPPPPGSTTALLTDRFLSMVGRKVDMTWDSKTRTVEVSGFPDTLRIGPRTLHLNRRLREQMALATIFIPQPRAPDGRWTEEVNYRERFQVSGWVFRGSGTRACRLVVLGDGSQRVTYDLKVDRWLQTPAKATDIRHTVQGEILFRNGYLQRSQVDIKMSWRQNGDLLHQEKQIVVENVQR